MNKKYQDLKVTRLPKREVEIVGAITAETMQGMRDDAIAQLRSAVTIDGFRAGNAPENMIVQKVGEMKIMEETAEMALNVVYPEILEDEKLDAIGRPEITITKIAPGQALEFKIKTALAPEVKLGNYKKIAKAASPIEPVPVTDAEIDAVILDVRKSIAHEAMHQQQNLAQGDHNHDEIKDEDLPPIDETFLTMVGGFKTVDELHDKVRENLTLEKQSKAKDKKRTNILEDVVKNSTIEIPQVIIDAEIEKMLAQFKDDIARMNVSFENYLKHIKKTEAEIRLEWQDTAEKRAKGQIVLSNIAREENIQPEEADIKREMDQILAQDTKLERFRVRMFVENFLTNEMVFKFLESQSEK